VEGHQNCRLLSKVQLRVSDLSYSFSLFNMRFSATTIVFLLSPILQAQSFNAEVNSISQKLAQPQETVQSKVQTGAVMSSKPKAPVDGSPPAKGGKSNDNIQPGEGYEGYRLSQTGDQDSTYYETANTRTPVSNEKEKPNKLPPVNVTLGKDPDVFLNATVHVSEISLTVLVSSSDFLSYYANLDRMSQRKPIWTCKSKDF